MLGAWHHSEGYYSTSQPGLSRLFLQKIAPQNFCEANIRLLIVLFSLASGYGGDGW